MVINQFVKKLNNNELGKGNTHETYVLVPQDVDIIEIFDEVNKEIIFVDKQTNENIKLRYTVGREKRIVGLGPYYTINKVSAGDQIIFEKINKGSYIQHYIDLKKRDNIIILQKYKNGFEILNLNRFNNEISNNNNVIAINDEVVSFEVKFKEMAKKRKDSPIETKFYDVLIRGTSILDKIKNNDYIELEFINQYVKVNKFISWEFNRLEGMK